MLKLALVSSLTAAALAVPAGADLVVSAGGRISVGGKAVARGEQPMWSPDGKRIAYVRDGRIYVAGRDGRNERGVARGTYPAWSPDGRRIAFSGARDLFVVPVAGGKPVRLTRSAHPWLGNFTPAWSPDGRTIAFSRSTDAFNNDIFLMDADGSHVRRLTRTQGTDAKLGEETMPTWSPDGRTIAFVSNRDGNFELYAIDLRSRRERRLTTTPRSNELNPRFGRDGRILYVHEDRIATIGLDGRGARELGRGEAADRLS